MRNTNVEDLEVGFRGKVKMLLIRLDQLGIEYLISETKRTEAVQTAYFAQGRQPLKIVNLLREKAGLWDISASENKNKITWTLKSKHIEGKAVDLVPKRENMFWWTAPYEEWEKIGKCAEEFGLVWGGRWEPKDMPHIQDK